MLRHTILSRVHLFTALVPKVHVVDDNYFTPEQLKEAKNAIEERKDILSAADFCKCLDSLQEIADKRQRQSLIKELSHVVDVYRAELYKKTTVDPTHRLQMHEAIMAAGFFQRAVGVNELKGEAVRFVLNHYNFDVRRDVLITKRVHESLHKDKETTEESDKLLRDLLLLERHLSGKYRLSPTGGRRWLVIGQPLSDIKTKEEMYRVLELEPIKAVGNFSLTEADTDKLWATLTLSAKDELEPSFLEEAALHESINDAEIRYDLRVQKPVKPLGFWEKFYDALLRFWVIWFSLWVMFFIVDEEIITLVALIVLKYRQTAIMEREAEKTGGKVYVATSTGRSF